MAQLRRQAREQLPRLARSLILRQLLEIGPAEPPPDLDERVEELRPVAVAGDTVGIETEEGGPALAVDPVSRLVADPDSFDVTGGGQAREGVAHVALRRDCRGRDRERGRIRHARGEEEAHDLGACVDAKVAPQPEGEVDRQLEGWGRRLPARSRRRLEEAMREED